MSAKDPFGRLVDLVLGGGGHRSVWGQHQRSASRGFDERGFRKALREYWGADADPMRVSLAVQDAVFVAGVVHMVNETLGLSTDDQRRVAAAVVRRRLLGEADPSLDDVEDAWSMWWPPPPGDDGRMLFAHFLGAWRSWLATSTP
ncbi:MAG TPA: hypothetical protein VGP92_04425 [Acidimicrobiia bacterium]|nr:hypothetical protein [Acidimicrobiia bacterium]